VIKWRLYLMHGLFMQIVVQLIVGGLQIKIFCLEQIFMCKWMQSIASSVSFSVSMFA
jgi:hypothetical protein